MNCDTFSRVRVNRSLGLGTEVSWELKRNFNAPSPLEFYVDVAPTGSEEWVTLNKEPIIGECGYLDTRQYNFAKMDGTTYRIRLVDAEGEVYYSNPQLMVGDWSKRDYLLAKEIMRKEYLQQVKFTGVKGTVLKRRNWGPRCPICLDHDTNAVTDGRCGICFGTGFIGGYFAGIESYVTLTPLSRNKVTTNVAVVDNIIRSGRTVAYPYLDDKDVWVNAQTGDRWIVDSIRHAAEMRSIPIVYESVYKLAPRTDVVYNIPLDSTSDITIYYDDTAPNNPVKQDDLDPVNVNNAPIVPPESQWDAGVNGDPYSW